MSRQRPGSASGVLLSKWLGEFGADTMAAMVGSENMTSSDWMLLALSSMGPTSQKQVGQAFVQRLLEKGDIHSAVALLLGFGEHDDAIEVYVSRGYHMEAVLLTCLTLPSDWQRQSYLVRKWGEVSVMKGQPELAVRCFSCTSLESTEPWSSPRAKDAVISSQREQGMGSSPLSPPISPPFAVGSSRKMTKNGSLKLITTFGDKGAPLVLPSADQRTPMAGMLGVGVTPIAESAISPGGVAPWLRSQQRFDRDPSSARTATPGGFARKRLPSRSGTSRTREPSQTPLTARRDVPDSLSTAEFETRRSGHNRNVSSTSSANKYRSIDDFSQHSSGPARLPSPSNGVFERLKSETRTRNGSRERVNAELQVQVVDTTYLAPHAFHQTELTGGPSDPFGVSSQVEDDGRSITSNPRGRPERRYINPPRRSPASPVSMSPDEVMASRANATAEVEAYYRQASPQRKGSISEKAPQLQSRASSAQRIRGPGGSGFRENGRDRSQSRLPTDCSARSPSVQRMNDSDADFGQNVSWQSLQSHKTRGAAVKETSVNHVQNVNVSGDSRRSPDDDSSASEALEEGVLGRRNLQNLTKKQIAARELEERRASLARRPSAPTIPLPGDITTPTKRPTMAPRYHTELGDTPSSFMPPFSRSQTADPESSGRFPPTRTTGTSTSSAPIGLPATPRAMRHPRYMTADPTEREPVPAIHHVPETPPKLASAAFDQTSPSPNVSEEDQIAPLLPSTVFGQKAPQSPPRSCSAPPETNMDGTPWHYKSTLPHSDRRGSIGKSGHSRKMTPTENQYGHMQAPYSPPSNRPSIDQTLHEAQVTVVDQPTLALPELQHLAGPPPPPPPPLMSNTGDGGSGMIDIAIGEEEPIVIDVMPTIERAGAMTAPPLNSIAQAQAQAQMQAQAQRRGRGSISEGINSKFRSVTERMRNTSKSRTKSPPVDAYAPSPYETVIPGMFPRHQPQIESQLAHVRSPYQISSAGASAAASEASLQYSLPPPPPPPPPPPAPPTSAVQTQNPFAEQVIPPESNSKPSNVQQLYSHPREARADLSSSETTLSQGVYQPNNMI